MITKEQKRKNREYYIRNKEKMKEYQQRPEVKLKMKEHNKKYRQKPEIKLKMKGYYKKYHKEYQKRPEVKLRIKEYWKEYRQKTEGRKKISSYMKNRRLTDRSFNLTMRLSNRLREAFKRHSITRKQYTSKKYGINFTAIIEGLKPFPKDIDNYEIDHIIPVSWFNHNDPKEIQWCWSSENFQWLTKEENRIKGNRKIYIKE